MGWKSGLAGLALCAGAALGWVVGGPGAERARAVEPGAAFARFEGRDYLLIWPTGAPSSVLVYLHVEGAQALGYEAGSGMLDALAAYGAGRGYAVIAPTAAVAACDRTEASSEGAGACWRLDAVGEELGHVDRLIASVETNAELRFEAREVVGYGRGGSLLAAGLAERRLQGYSKVGLLLADPPAAPLPIAGAEGPLIYLEAAEGDRAAAATAGALLADLVAAGYGSRTCAKGDLGGRDYDLRRLQAFMVWFAQDCRLAPGASPTSAGGAGEPSAVRPTSTPVSAPVSAPVAGAGDDGGGPARQAAQTRRPR